MDVSYIWFQPARPDSSYECGDALRPRVYAAPGSVRRQELVRRLTSLRSCAPGGRIGEVSVNGGEDLQNVLDIAEDARKVPDRVISVNARLEERLSNAGAESAEQQLLGDRLRTDWDLLRRTCERAYRDRDDMRVMRDRAQAEVEDARREADASKEALGLVRRDLEALRAERMGAPAPLLAADACLDEAAVRRIAALHRDMDDLARERDAAVAASAGHRRRMERMAQQLAMPGGLEAFEALAAVRQERDDLKDELNMRKSLSFKASSSPSASSGRVGSTGCVFHTTGLLRHRASLSVPAQTHRG